MRTFPFLIIIKGRFLLNSLIKNDSCKVVSTYLRKQMLGS
jgi:hypothetical protein